MKRCPLKVFEANSYNVHEDRLSRIVFITELKENGTEIMLCGFSSEEHGARSKANERHRSYLQYLASTCLEPRETRRRNPTVAEAALVCYARFLELTYKSSYFHIWVDPPDASMPEYMFRHCSTNVGIPYSMKNKKVERSKLMKSYSHIFNAWDLQSYLWRPEIPLPPQFEKDFKSQLDEDDGEEVNVRKELQILMETARKLSTKLNKYFEDRTLVVYLSEVTILARDPKDPERLMTKVIGDNEYVVEVGVEDVSPLCPAPFPAELIISNLVKNKEMTFAKNEDHIGSTKKLREMVRQHMSHPDLWTRDEHQRALGIVEVEDE